MQKVCLYIATHNVTKLKYFGKTTRFLNLEDLQKKYHGSGKYWLAHLKKHGDDVTMEIYGIFDIDKVEKIALQFSIDNNIVKSLNENKKKIWANEIYENGLSGGSDKSNYSQERKDKIRAKAIGRIGPKHTEEHKKYIKEKLSGSNCYMAKKIIIFNSKHEVIFECNGNFKNTCNKNNLPFQAFEKSYKTGRKVYEGVKNNIISRLTKSGNIIYKDWYVLPQEI